MTFIQYLNDVMVLVGEPLTLAEIDYVATCYHHKKVSVSVCAITIYEGFIDPC